MLFFTDVGSGDSENGTSLNLYKECADRVLMPCDSEEFITVNFKIFISTILSNKKYYYMLKKDIS